MLLIHIYCYGLCTIHRTTAVVLVRCRPGCLYLAILACAVAKCSRPIVLCFGGKGSVLGGVIDAIDLSAEGCRSA